MAGPDSSPQYLALQDQIANVIEIIQLSIPEVAPKLQARGLVSPADTAAAINAVDAGRNNAVIAQKLMQPVQLKVKLSPDSFYDLVDALNCCSLVFRIGETLERHCGEFMTNITCRPVPVAVSLLLLFFLSPLSTEKKGGKRQQQGKNRYKLPKIAIHWQGIKGAQS